MLTREEVGRIEREAVAELEQELIEGDLRAVREAAGLSQVEAAKLAEMRQVRCRAWTTGPTTGSPPCAAL